ncbi:MAG TPA: hypothetical protein ENI81_07525 [Phycisphaerales bacterium]|nr:hypothetical protein [Phycisphaerales bacterium]
MSSPDQSQNTALGERIGPFVIERELGRGAMGVVYLARDTKLDRPVAIKSLPNEVTVSPDARSRFMREAKVLASLNHLISAFCFGGASPKIPDEGSSTSATRLSRSVKL